MSKVPKGEPSKRPHRELVEKPKTHSNKESKPSISLRHKEAEETTEWYELQLTRLKEKDDDPTHVVVDRYLLERDKNWVKKENKKLKRSESKQLQRAREEKQEKGMIQKESGEDMKKKLIKGKVRK